MMLTPPLTSCRPQRSTHRARLRALAVSSLAVFGMASIASCIDTTIPDLSRELGDGKTDGPFCSPDVLEFFPPQQLRVTVLDVGQGDAIWVQTPYFDDQEAESLNILIDAGPSGNVSGTGAGGAVVVDYLVTNGLQFGEALDALVISHAHEDHYGGVPAVVSAFDIERYVDPGFTGGSSGFAAARSAAVNDTNAIGGRSQFPAVPELTPQVYAPTDLFGPNVEATLLWGRDTPPNGASSSPSGTDINNTSVAFAIRWRGEQILLLADVENAVEQDFIVANDAGSIDLSSAVLKVAHHGSSSSSSREFLARVFPDRDSSHWAVISSGTKSFSGTTLPTEETLLNLAEFLEPNHTLSTQNRDEIKPAGTELGDDHIIITIDTDGVVQACYASSSG